MIWIVVNARISGNVSAFNCEIYNILIFDGDILAICEVNNRGIWLVVIVNIWLDNKEFIWDGKKVISSTVVNTLNCNVDNAVTSAVVNDTICDVNKNGIWVIVSMAIWDVNKACVWLVFNATNSAKVNKLIWFKYCICDVVNISTCDVNKAPICDGKNDVISYEVIDWTWEVYK